MASEKSIPSIAFSLYSMGIEITIASYYPEFHFGKETAKNSVLEDALSHMSLKDGF